LLRDSVADVEKLIDLVDLPSW